MDQVALARVVLTSREHMMAIEARDKGLVGTLLRYPYEVRDADKYFEDIPSPRVTKDMIDLAKHIVKAKAGHFKPEKFEDQYEEALKDLLRKKRAGEKITAPKTREPAKVINLMDALRRSVETERGGRRTTSRRAPRRAASQRSGRRAGGRARRAG
jgi:Ku protein